MDRPIDVILDTDIGDDIDDTWALAMLLRSPELRLRLVLTAGPGHHDGRALLVADILAVDGRTDVPIGLGCMEKTSRLNKHGLRQAAAVEDFSMPEASVGSAGVLGTGLPGAFGYTLSTRRMSASSAFQTTPPGLALAGEARGEVERPR